MTDDDLYTHQLPRAVKSVQPYVLSLYPQLEGVGVDVVINSFDDAKAFVDEQKKVFGDKLVLTPIPKEYGYSHIDPVEELAEMRSKRKR